MPEASDLAGLRSALARRIAIRTESQNPERKPELRRYLVDELTPTFERMGFATALWDNPIVGGPPFLFAERIEDPQRTTVLMYGHGDVVLGYDEQWKRAASPWLLEHKDDRWYGRGTADNKGQHSINLAAIEHVLEDPRRAGVQRQVAIRNGRRDRLARVARDLRNAQGRARRRRLHRE